MVKERNNDIDILKGIAVLAVLLGHAIQRGMENGTATFLFKVIYSFHMPLFMLLSGYVLYKYTKEYSLKLVWKKFVRLIIPTIVWNYLIYFVRDLSFVGIQPYISFPDSVIEYTKLLISYPGYIIWFLHVVFIASAIIILIKKYIKNEYIQIGLLILISIIFYLIPTDLYNMRNVRIYFPIFVFGFYLAKYFSYIKPYIKYMYIPCCILYVILFPFYNTLIDKPIIFYMISLVSILMIYYLTKVIYINKINNALSFFGKYSLEIYLCQCLCLNIGVGSGVIRVISIMFTATLISSVLAVLTNKSKILKTILYGKF